MKRFGRVLETRDCQRQEGSSGSFGKLGELRDDGGASFGISWERFGPGHLAASLGIPTRIVFRSTDRKIWAPWVRGSKLTNRFRKPEDFVRNRIDQCFPTCGDDVVAHPDRAPGLFPSVDSIWTRVMASVPRLLSKSYFEVRQSNFLNVGKSFSRAFLKA